jgi:hypothetical protein
MRQRTNVPVLAAFALACAFLPVFPITAQPKPAQDATELTARVEGFLRNAGYEHGKVKANSFYINVKGNAIPKIRILLGIGSNNIAVRAVVATKGRFNVTAESM